MDFGGGSWHARHRYALVYWRGARGRGKPLWRCALTYLTHLIP